MEITKIANTVGALVGLVECALCGRKHLASGFSKTDGVG